MGNYPEYADEYPDFKIPTAVQPQNNGFLDQLVQSQTDLAKQYRSDMSQHQKMARGDNASQNKIDLKSNLTNVDRSFNKRGLLHSGMRTGARAATTYGMANDLSAKNLQSNQDIVGQADQLDQNAINTGYQAAGLGADLSEQALGGLKTSLANQIASMQYQSTVANGIGNFVGNAGGTIAASYGKSKTPSTGLDGDMGYY